MATAAPTKPCVLLVHGILSSGAWHRRAHDILDPYFRCVSLRYRAYHALGILNIFFWPWALLFAALVGWVYFHGSVPTATFWIYHGILVGVAVCEAARSGLGRALPWLIVAGFSSGALGWNSEVAWLAAVGAVATGLAHVAGDLWRRRFVVWSLGWIALALIVPVIAGAAGVFFAKNHLGGWLPTVPHFQTGPRGLFVLTALLIGLYSAYREWEWERVSAEAERRPHQWKFFCVPLSLALLALFAGWYPEENNALLLLWMTSVGLMWFLEIRENSEMRGIRWLWDGTVIIVGIATMSIWSSLVRRDEGVMFAYQAALLAFGWFEPRWRVWRTVAYLQNVVQHHRNPGGLLHEVRKVDLIAHSLGTYMSARLLEHPQLQKDFLFGQVVLVGAALSEHREWRNDLAGAFRRIGFVQNEFGTLDFVIKLLWLSGAWARRQGMGGAGFVGLQPADWKGCHLVSAPRAGPCPPCGASRVVAEIHNYRFGRFTHTTITNLAAVHGLEFWLPYLWGHSPYDVQQFGRGCLILAEALPTKTTQPVDYQDKLGRLLALSTNWHLINNGWRTLREQIREHVGSLMVELDGRYPGVVPRPSDQIEERTAQILAEKVPLAVSKYDRGETLSPALFAFHNPSTAVVQAAKEACREVVLELNKTQPPPSRGAP